MILINWTISNLLSVSFYILALLDLTLNPEQFLFFSFRYAAITLCGINKLCVIQSQHCAHKKVFCQAFRMIIDHKYIFVGDAAS